MAREQLSSYLKISFVFIVFAFLFLVQNAHNNPSMHISALSMHHAPCDSTLALAIMAAYNSGISSGHHLININILKHGSNILSLHIYQLFESHREIRGNILAKIRSIWRNAALLRRE